MSKSSSNNSTNSTTTTAPTDNWGKTPCVQYGFPDDKGPTRTPKLRTIFDPIPEGATTASPIYALTRDQYERQQQLDSGYEVVGDYLCIATELQDECEAEDRVLYPIHIESDVYHEEDPATLIEWFRGFVEDRLDVPFHSCTLYFSGNRSIHVHVPRFVSGEDKRNQLKELAKQFCDETGAELDCGLYSAKRLFRLPGVKHAKSTLRKVEIRSEWDKDRIFHEAHTTTSGVPESYGSVLRHVFTSQSSLVLDSPQTSVDPPYDLFQVLDSDKTVLGLAPSGQGIETPLIEQERHPEDTAQGAKWKHYNAKEFSPYANSDGNRRSVAALKIEGGAFSRKGKREGATMVPAYFYGAIGCDGKFTKHQNHAPLQLSKRDYQKWDYKIGDHIVVLGGRSRNSRILSVDAWTARVVGHALTGEGASREAALDYLGSEGYSVGEKKANKSNEKTVTTGRANNTSAQSVYTQQTEAAALQQQAEEEGIETLSHEERFCVACRLLRFGWEAAWEWFKQRYGTKFKPDVTRRQLLSVINSYPNDYSHVEVPP